MRAHRRLLLRISTAYLLPCPLRVPQEERSKVRDLFLYSRAHLRADAPLPPPEELPDCPVDCECARQSVGRSLPGESWHIQLLLTLAHPACALTCLPR